jgi:hypothetical protein
MLASGPVELSAPVHVNVVRAADFNRDATDLIAAATFARNQFSAEPSGIIIFLGAHDSTSRPHVVSSVASQPLCIGDLNADGNPDLLLLDMSCDFCVKLRSGVARSEAPS